MVAASLNLWCHSTGAVLALRGNQEPIQQVVWIARHWVCRSSTLPSNDLSDNHNFQELAHLPGVQIVSQRGNQNGLRRMYMDVSLMFMDLHKTWGKMLKTCQHIENAPKKRMVNQYLHCTWVIITHARPSPNLRQRRNRWCESDRESRSWRLVHP